MKNFVIIFWTLIPLVGFSQKEDYVWLAGRENNTQNQNYGGIKINFNNNPPAVNYQYRKLNFFQSNASICDSSGQLLFYTNGCDLAGQNDTILPNGDGLNPGYFHDLRCDQWDVGYGGGYPSAVILPLPDSDSTYYLFHKTLLFLGEPNQSEFRINLLYTVVHMNSVSGKGYVTKKNEPVTTDSLAAGELGAVKHANGKDWWLFTPRRNSNTFYTFLFTAEGIVDTLVQTIGDLPPVEEESSGQTTFSHDGSTLARYFPYHDLMLYDFDRATGLFSNYRTIGVQFGDLPAFDGGCTFSPSGRYLYVMALTEVYQFDLWAADIASTQTTVGVWDGFTDPIATVFVSSQLGPDCKIYSQCGDMRYYHVIHRPDEPGLACQFEQRGMVLPTPSGASIPYFPNYRLGPIENPGLPCTPTVSVSPEPFNLLSGAVRVYPNPADGYMVLEYALSGMHRPQTCRVYNALGQLLLEKKLSGGLEGKETLPVGHLPEGVYHVLLDNATPVKVVIKH
jgi:hypothetical protein